MASGVGIRTADLYARLLGAVWRIFSCTFPCRKSGMVALRFLSSRISGAFFFYVKEIMKRDSFSCLHPAVNFIFFIGALGFGVVILPPVFLIAGLVCAFSYYLLLHGTQGLKRMVLMSAQFLAVILLNPFANQDGTSVLFVVMSKRYTLEALIYGAVLSGMLLTVILRFSCCSAVMAGGKFTSL